MPLADENIIRKRISDQNRNPNSITMTYQAVTSRMEEKNSSFNILWTSDGGKAIGSMTVQYKETDWSYARRLAGRLGKVMITGQGGAVLQKGGSVVSVDDAIDISSEHTRVQ